MMHRKDKVKLGIAMALFALIAITYAIDGKSNITKSVVVIAVVLWLLTMRYLKNKFNENKQP